MEFKNISLNEMNRIEQLTDNGVEIYENELGAVFIIYNPEICLYDFIGAYVDYHDYITVKDWNQFGAVSNDCQIIKILF